MNEHPQTPAFACPDTDRARRTGAGETIYGEGKTAAQIASIVQSLVEAGQARVLVTRLDAGKSAEVAAILAGEMPALEVTEFPEGRLLAAGPLPAPVTGNGTVAVVCAGTSDLFCAEEAAVTLEFLGNRVQRVYDVGVAGIHRLLSRRDVLDSAQVIIVIAGMEGALPSVVAGLVHAPVIAVPTHVGYGANLGGVTTLLAMLTSCADGVSVVNIDNGFGAARQASAINHLPGPEGRR